MNQLVPYTELLVNPLDADDICNKCNQLLSNPTYLKEKIEQGLDFVKKYDWYKSAKLIENYMHDCN